MPDLVKKEDTNLVSVSEALFNSKLFPNVGNRFGAFAVVQYGAELGLGPMTSLQTMAIIKGKICMAAQMMLTLAVNRGVRYKVLVDTNTESKVHFEREGFAPYDSVFTLEDAKKAGIYRQDSGWDKFPKDMLFWRAITRGLRRIAPDVVLGLYSKEEIAHAPAIDAHIEEDPKIPSERGEESQVTEEIKDEYITEGQAKRFFAIAKGSGRTNQEIKNYLAKYFSVEHSRDIRQVDYQDICKWAESQSREPGEEG